MFGRVMILGLGMIGGSLASALKRAAIYESVEAYTRRSETWQWAQQHHIIDHGSSDIKDCANADIIIFATPLNSMAPLLKEVLPYLKPTVIITDVGSVKAQWIKEAKALLLNLVQFVPGHPIAGSEKTGVTAANPDLFIDHRVILTPLTETSSDAINTIDLLWKSVGAIVEIMSPQKHDEILAATSHAPHFLAYTLVDTFAQRANVDELMQYAAGGFRDFTRIAASDPHMWHDIFLQNHEALLQVVTEFEQNLNQLKTHIVNKNSADLLLSLQRAQKTRDHFGEAYAKRLKKTF